MNKYDYEPGKHYCSNCSSFRKVIKVGYYSLSNGYINLNGSDYGIYICSYCMGWKTRKKENKK